MGRGLADGTMTNGQDRWDLRGSPAIPNASGTTAGPDHQATFTVRVSVKNVGEAEATASNKQDAETAAAKLFMEKFG